MLGDGALSLREFLMHEPVPLADVHRAVLELLSGMDDAVLFGAQAVNAYVDQPRMTQDVDVLSPRAAALAEQIREHLNSRFHIAVRVRSIGDGQAFRVYQLQEPKNRHLVDVRSVALLPPTQRMGDLLVVAPEELIAGKLLAFHRRRGTPKSGTDWRDLALLLLAFPHFKTNEGPVRERLHAAGADASALAAWESLVAEPIRAEEDDDEL